MNGAQKVWLGAMVVLALLVGVLWGMRSLPPSETEIINEAAAAYVAETGGRPTDCAARPSQLADVRLVVVCADGAWVAAFDAHGRSVTVDPDVLEGEPVT